MAIGKIFIRKIDLVVAVGPVTDGRPLVLRKSAEPPPHLFTDHHLEGGGGRRLELFITNESHR